MGVGVKDDIRGLEIWPCYQNQICEKTDLFTYPSPEKDISMNSSLSLSSDRHF